MTASPRTTRAARHAAGRQPRPVEHASVTGGPGGPRSPGQAGELAVMTPARPARSTGAGLLIVASGLLLLLAAAQGYVSFRAQYVFVDAAKHAYLPSVLEALGLDTGAVIFALLALSLARRGGRARVERSLNVACAIGSLTMNLLAADLGSPRSVTVWVLPSALYALASDRLIAVVRRWVQASNPGAGTTAEGSVWRAAGGLVLWALRLVLDAPGTAAGFRRWVLAAAPVAPGTRATPLVPAQRRPLNAADDRGTCPSGPGESGPHQVADAADPAGRVRRPRQPAGDVADRAELVPGETKREALIRLYEQCGAAGDPRYGDRARAAAVAGEIAALIGYHPGTARRELVRYLASRDGPVTTPEPQTERREVTDR